MNKIKEIYNWYKEFNNKEIVIQTENKNLEIKITNTALPHFTKSRYRNYDNLPDNAEYYRDNNRKRVKIK